MARYTIEGREAGIRIIVGWDNPLRTYFTQVWKGEEPWGELLLWVGTNFDEVPDVQALAEAVAPHGDIPPEVQTQLLDDRAERELLDALQQLLVK